MQAPCPVWLVAVAKVLSGAVQGVLAAAIVLPDRRRSCTPRACTPTSTSTGWIILTLVPLACVAFSALGLFLGTKFEPRNIGLMFGFIVLPITFLGGTYYPWTRLAPVKVGGFHWLQTLVLINPLIYVNEGMRAAFTDAPHMRRSPDRFALLPAPRPALRLTSPVDSRSTIHRLRLCCSGGSQGLAGVGYSNTCSIDRMKSSTTS